MRYPYLLHTAARVALASLAYHYVFSSRPGPGTLIHLAAACFWTHQAIAALRQVLGHVPTPGSRQGATKRERAMLQLRVGGLYVTRDFQHLFQVIEIRPSRTYPFEARILRSRDVTMIGSVVTYTQEGFQYESRHETSHDLVEEFTGPLEVWQPGMRSREVVRPWQEVYALGSLHVTQDGERLAMVTELNTSNTTEPIECLIVACAVDLPERMIRLGDKFRVDPHGRFIGPENHALDLQEVWRTGVEHWSPRSGKTVVRTPEAQSQPGQLVPIQGDVQVNHLYQTRRGTTLVQIEEGRQRGETPFGGKVVWATGGDFPMACTWARDGRYNPPGQSGYDLLWEWTGTVEAYEAHVRPAPQTYSTQADDRVRSTHQQLQGALERTQRLMGSMSMGAGFAEVPVGFNLDFANGGRIVMGNPEAKVQVAPASPPPVHWDDIIGQEEAKSLMRDAIEAQSTHADIYAHFGMPQAKGVLLYGPPGCGKTMLGKAAAGALATIHGKPYKDGFIYRNGAQMMGPGWMDETNFFKHAFDEAEKFFKDHGYPAVVFFDECDACLPPRERTSMFHRNAVNLFLTRMDGMEARTCFVILATNHLEMLDEAAIRPGRVDKRIYVGHPSKEDVRALFQTYLGKLLLKPGEERDALVTQAHAELFHEKYALEDYEWTQKLTGAMLAGIADEARRLAFRRACRVKTETGAFDPAEAGVTLEDVLSGVRGLYAEQKVMLERRRKDPNNPENWVRRTEKLADKTMDRLERLRDGQPPPDDLDDLDDLLGGKTAGGPL